MNEIALVRASLDAGDHDLAVRLLSSHGQDILARAGMATLIELLERVPEKLWTTRMRLVHAEALALNGDVDGSRSRLTDLVAGRERIEPGLARRLGYLDYRNGDVQAALDVYRHGLLDQEDTEEEALLLAWMSVAHWAAGQIQEAVDAAERAAPAARRAASYRAEIAANIALGFTAEARGVPSAEQHHYEVVLELAEKNRDVIQTALARNNRASRLFGEGRLTEALADARVAIESAETIGLAAIMGMALCNAGRSLRQLGRLDEAVEMFERAIALEHRVGSAWLSRPLADIGDVHRLRGQVNLARAAYEEAARIAEDHGDRHGLVPALAGLALTLADHDAAAARAAVDRARPHAVGPPEATYLAAAGHVARAAGDRAEAADLAQRAAAAARLHRDRFALASALELVAVTTEDARLARQSLEEACGILRGLDARIDVDVLVALSGTLPDSRVGDRTAAKAARDRLAAAGIPVPGHTAWSGGAGRPVVEVLTLGRFAVVIDGTPVQNSVWQSRKARELFRLLLARRGRPVPREELCVLLWGDDDLEKTTHRLAVALSTVRSVLDPDRSLPSDCFIITDASSVALDTSRLIVDLERFLEEADHGLRLRARGDVAGAREALVIAEQRYGGDFLEDEPYTEAGTAVRALARARYLQVLRALVEICREAADFETCIHYLHRILAVDPYDEQGHQDLIAVLTDGGSHGEARRARDRYRRAMAELDG
ncbi:BTAD domain-containing putative transcriptional regulator [Catenulispora subtropica]|uniref:Uncharacterized protein n=1 Tax=Catenulispora subtropica TaxID=450798 RepID=A0ABP5CEN0_9ACTN